MGILANMTHQLFPKRCLRSLELRDGGLYCKKCGCIVAYAHRWNGILHPYVFRRYRKYDTLVRIRLYKLVRQSSPLYDKEEWFQRYMMRTMYEIKKEQEEREHEHSEQSEPVPETC